MKITLELQELVIPADLFLGRVTRFQYELSEQRNGKLIKEGSKG